MSNGVKVVKDAIQNKDGAADALVAYIYYDIFYFALSKIGANEAEEIAQQTMMKIVQGIQGLKDPRAFKSWAFSIANREALNVLRRNAKTAPSSDEYSFDALPSHDEAYIPEEYVLNVEKRKVLIETISELPSDYSSCILLYYFEGMSYEEIAQALDVNEARVKNSLYRGRSLLRKILEGKAGKSFALAPALVSANELSQALSLDAQTYQTPELIDSCLNVIHAGSLVGVAQGAVAATSLSIKAVVGLGLGAVSLTAVVGVGILSTTPQDEQEAVIAAEEQVLDAPTESTPTVPEKEIEEPINTLSDLIGSDNERVLQAFVEQGVDDQTWTSFISELTVEVEDVALEENLTYRLYSLTRQTKQLMLISRQAEGSEMLEIRFSFGDVQEDYFIFDAMFLFD